MRAELCPCGHARDTHYLADSVAYACLSPHCACGLYDSRAITPVRVLPTPPTPVGVKSAAPGATAHIAVRMAHEATAEMRERHCWLIAVVDLLYWLTGHGEAP